MSGKGPNHRRSRSPTGRRREVSVGRWHQSCPLRRRSVGRWRPRSPQRNHSSPRYWTARRSWIRLRGSGKRSTKTNYSVFGCTRFSYNSFAWSGRGIILGLSAVLAVRFCSARSCRSPTYRIRITNSIRRGPAGDLQTDLHEICSWLVGLVGQVPDVSNSF